MTTYIHSSVQMYLCYIHIHNNTNLTDLLIFCQNNVTTLLLFYLIVFTAPQKIKPFF